MNFLIGFPFNGPVENVGGLLAIKKLTNVLTDLNQTVYVIGSSFHNEKTKKINNISEVDLKKTVVIYPETVVGNPFGGKNVVRWILYHTTKPNPPGIFHKLDFKTFLNLKKGIEYTWKNTDEYFYYNNYFDTIKKREKKILTVYDFRLDEFYDLGLERDGYCHLFHKNNINQSFVEKYESEHIPSGNWKGIVEMFNKKKFFLTYDDSTYFLNISALCGCIPIVLYDNKKENYKNSNPLVKYGIAYGMDEIEHAKNTMSLIRPNLIEQEENSIETVKYFIEYCDRKFKK
jgi:hypothetical protein